MGMAWGLTRRSATPISLLGQCLRYAAIDSTNRDPRRTMIITMTGSVRSHRRLQMSRWGCCGAHGWSSGSLVRRRCTPQHKARHVDKCCTMVVHHLVTMMGMMMAWTRVSKLYARACDTHEHMP